MQSLKKCQLIQRLAFEWEFMRDSFTREELEKEEDYAGMDVRLQLLDSDDWVLHLGDSQYDTDHRGYWGVGFLDYDWEREDLKEDLVELAEDLIDQSKSNLLMTKISNSKESSMSINKKKTVQIAKWTEDDYNYKGVVEYGMYYSLGNSQPYFSITASTWCKSSKGRVWREDSGGCLHDLITKRKKLLAVLIPFHLSDQNGLPMYYLENGYYWYKKNLETFKDYVRLSDNEQIPEVPKIELPIVLSETGKELDLPEKQKEKFIEYTQKQFITQWLKTREDKLKQEFDEVMTVFGVDYITEEEINLLKANS